MPTYISQAVIQNALQAVQLYLLQLIQAMADLMVSAISVFAIANVSSHHNLL